MGAGGDTDPSGSSSGGGLELGQSAQLVVRTERCALCGAPPGRGVSKDGRSACGEGSSEFTGTSRVETATKPCSFSSLAPVW